MTHMVASCIQAFRFMCLSRNVDSAEQTLVEQGQAFFHVSGAGHGVTALFGHYLNRSDYLHCHYRDKALMLARGIALVQLFNSVLCNADGQSAGRQMSAHLSDPERHVLSLVGPIGNNALQAAGVAAHIKDGLERPIVLCSLGDGTSQQGEVLEAIAEAVRCELPVLFLVQDNRYSISTSTRGKTFFSRPDGNAGEFYGLPILRLDGRDAWACDEPIGKIIAAIRKTRRPALVVMDVERLSDHTNADDENVYRSEAEISHARSTGDPIVILRRRLLESGVSESRLVAIEASAKAEVEAAAAEALKAPAPTATFTAKAPLPDRLQSAQEIRGSGIAPALTMAEAIRETLRTRMAMDGRVTLYGEDIEDPKGDVFGVTRGLTVAFPGRVKIRR